MNNTALKELFSKPFDLQNWIEVLRTVFSVKHLYRLPQAIRLPNNDKAEAAFELGNFNTIDDRLIGLYHIKIKPNIRLERNKVGLRELLHNIYKNDVDGAIIVFEQQNKWRLSFVSDIKVRNNEGEIVTQTTEPKRYTYLLGEGEKVRTPADRFSALTGKKLHLEDIRKLFSVATLTKDFYNELFKWYEWTLSDEVGVTFPKNTNTPEDNREKLEEQIIRLITRLLFVWFIKQKKLVPDNLFSANALKPILKNFKSNDAQNGNYYNAILQNLFFATLNKTITGRAFAKEENTRDIKNLYRYAEMFSISEDEIIELFKPVPFLNGGLFECLDKEISTDGIKYHLDGFSRNDKKVKEQFSHRAFIPNCVFFDEQKGIIPLLERYNFTVEENAPEEVQVALDPELLGNVFENLLGAFNSETRDSARKQSGSFYTPREIVDFMVNESLLEYIKSAVSIPADIKSTLSIPAQTKEQDTFEAFFNPYNEIEIHQGNLPHWQQEEVWYFITFRLADSLPKEVVEEIKIKREEWLKRRNGLKPENLSIEEKKEYYRLSSGRIEELLSAGKGSCILKEPKIAKIVADALLHFNNKRYVLDEWVIMPNHVHILVKPLANHKLPDILHSWKSFTANEINKVTGNKGQLWMHESYDHIVRNEKALNAIRNYIRQNPVKAKLKVGEFLLNESKDMLVVRSKDASGTFEARLRELFSYTETPNTFDEKETKAIIEAINNCKILDPACGSGAFPMGILHKMVNILQKLDPENKYWKDLQRQKAIEETEAALKIGDKEERGKRLAEINDVFENNASDYGRKLYLIENCIYGIDIQTIAAQISKLRFFISLIVEQGEMDFNKENYGVITLPNLETKFVAANTLISIGAGNSDPLDLNKAELLNMKAELWSIREKHFYAKGAKEKKSLRKEDEKLREKIKTYICENAYKPREDFIALYKEEISKQEAERKKYEGENWVETTENSTQGDLFEALPKQQIPFKTDKNKEERTRIDKLINNLKDKIKLEYEREKPKGFEEEIQNLAAWNPYDQNSSSPFFDVEWMFGVKDGFDIVIGNPPYVQLQKEGGRLAQMFEKEGYQTFARTGDIYSLFYEKGHELLKGNGNLCFITSNKWMRAGYGENTRQFFAENTNPVLLIDFAGQKIFESATVDTNILLLSKQKNQQKTLACIVKEKVLNELSVFVRQNGNICPFNTADSWVILSDIERSIKEKIERIGTPLKDWDIQINYGIKTGFNEAFIIDGAKRKELIEQDPKSDEIIRPILRGRDIKRYGYDFADLWLINTHNGIKEKGIKPINIKDYPAIKKHLDGYWKEIEKRADQGITPYNLRNCAYMDDFSKQKIMYPNMTKFLPFYLDDKGFMQNDKSFMITGKNVAFLTAFLNSSIFKYCFIDNFPELQGGTRELRKIFIEKIPVLKVSEKTNKEFEKLVIKLQDSIANKKPTTELEMKIDEMIFDLYALTKEERKTIGFVEIH